MRRLFFLFLTTAVLLTPARPQRADSIQLRAATLAARGETALLRPLYRAHRTELPAATRLYCEMALARADGELARATGCLDTLLADHADRFDTNGRLALVELKASLLRQEGRYAELKSLCQREIPRFRRKRVGPGRLSRLENYLRKAERLSADTPRARLLGLADRDRAFELQDLYGSLAGRLDPYARTCCALVLACAFHDGQGALRHSDSLLAHHLDSLDADGLTFCLRAHADLLAASGEWARLRAFCRTYGDLDRPHGVPLRHYALMAEAWAGLPATTLSRPARDCAVPLSPQWPLFVPVRPNGRAAGPFLLDTGQSYTLLPEEEARRCGLHILPDTLSVASPAGMLSVSPARADSLVLGDIVFKDLVVYAVHPADYADPVYTRVIGCNELLRLPAMTFHPEKLVFPYPRAFAEGRRPDMRVSPEGTLRLRAACAGQTRVFSLDTGSSDDVFSASAFPVAATDTLGFGLSVGGRTYPSPCPVFTEGRAADHDGLVGVPFLRQFGAVRFDFRAMTLEVEGPDEQAGRSPGQPASPDAALFALARNESSYRQTAAPEEGALLHLAVLAGMNLPDSVAALAEEAEAAFSLDEEERAFLRATRLRALLQAGREDEAARLLAATDEARRADAPAHKACIRQIKRLRLAARHAPMRWRTTDSPADVAFSPGMEARQAVPALVNRRQTVLTPAPTQEETDLTERAARKSGVRAYFEDGPERFGIIDSLRVGTFVLCHVRCRIVPGKEEGIRLGWNALRLLGGLEYRPGGIRLHRAAPAPQDGARPIRFDGEHLFVEEETPTGYDVTRLTPDLIGRLVSRRGSVCLDFRHMRLSLRTRNADTPRTDPLQGGSRTRMEPGPNLHPAQIDLLPM